MIPEQNVKVSEQIGIIGLGKMGQALASRLTGQGHEVRGWNRSGISNVTVEETQITACDSLADLASNSTIIIISVSDAAAVTSVLKALCKQPLHGKLIADASTVEPRVLQDLEHAVLNRGASLIDVPVAGGPAVALKGELGVFAGGAAEDVARYAPVCEAFSNRMFHVGALGNGYVMKAINNMVLAGFLQTMTEAVSMGKHSGFSLEDILNVITSGPAANPFLFSRLPVILKQADTLEFSLIQALDDMQVFQNIAIDKALKTPALDAALRSVKHAISVGKGDQDIVRLITHAYEDTTPY
ncbi:NAD(P)-dependent oxidoreductase [Aliamphritea hakodatensis]|uniref:NAD(P)-dependent oxidoreductase n=1 Tax=Aliamphritea hakodatensis TaxID=2895352 RepID=UPI0022FD950B|nr:NAD(P)-dependent oxidoreductase [Aliamphritea hakodatensis]